MKNMLIDATSPSEIRLAIVNEKKLDNYEFESRPTKYTKGNIYLAKVVRVEPSLQAAFVEYADNTQGFLPFSEIHPDYYRIPVEDYEALMEEQRAKRQQENQLATDSDDDSEDEEQSAKDNTEAESQRDSEQSDVSDSEAAEVVSDAQSNVVDDDADLDEDGERPLIATPKLAKAYKIQEVIKRGQLMLVQVSKEERGKKRAALSTYIALAGCYCVLIPNALFNGGVSRKIESSKERKRLKKVLSSIEITEGMALILRTAAEGKTKASINRELKYLKNFWDELRKRTMDSVAPLLIHEEGDLINRSLRDIFSKQIEEVYIAGSDAYKQAKEFTKLLNPKLSRSIKEFVPKGHETLFESFGLEQELQSLVQSEVEMSSGGALVIEQTEALVSIDVNSGRAIGERTIEETALKINLEAAEEIARQLRLRNLAGLVVCDFIDMDRRGNQQKVEKTLKSALRFDKARIHVGRISSFGLLEMSRQRLGPSIQEKITDICPQCQGHGRVLHQDGMVAALMRAIHQRMSELSKNTTSSGNSAPMKVSVFCLPQVAQILLNNHLSELQALEKMYGIKIHFEIDANLRSVYGWSLEKGRGNQRDRNKRRERSNNRNQRRKDKDAEETDSTENATEENATEGKPAEEGGRNKKRRRSRNRRSEGQNATGSENTENQEGAATEVSSDTENSGEASTVETEKTSDKPKRRRRTRKPKTAENAENPQQDDATEDGQQATSEAVAEEIGKTEKAASKPSQKKPVKAKPAQAKPAQAEKQPKDVPAQAAPSDSKPSETKPVDTKPVESKSDADEPAAVRGKPQPDATADIKPKRKGWWNTLLS